MKSTFLSIFLSSCYLTLYAQQTITDIRDGEVYEILKLGDVLIMNENLNYLSPTSWCFENKNAPYCETGNYYYANEANEVCPNNWRLPTWKEFVHVIYAVADSMKIPRSHIKFDRNLPVEEGEDEFAQMITGISLVNDEALLKFIKAGWIQGKKHEASVQENMWIVYEDLDFPPPHIHMMSDEILIHSHHHNINDKPKRIRRFPVRCVKNTNTTN